MSVNLNKVLLMGNLTRDVELKYTPSNQPVAAIGIAMNRRFRTRDGEDRDETVFVDCEAWGRTAEVMSQYLSKGRPVFIEGRLKLDQWQDKDGNNRSKLRVVVENFQFVDSRPGGQDPPTKGEPVPTASSAGSSGAQHDPPTASAAASSGTQHEPVAEDDIPF